MTIVFDFLRKYHWLFVTKEKNVLQITKHG